MKKSFANKTALITGGAAGIGKIMARLLLEQKARVVIWDINQERIDETVNDFSAIGSIAGYRVDVSNPEEVKNAARRVKAEIGFVDILINNAGIVVGRYFHEHTTNDILKTLEVNTIAPMVVTNEFLSEMITRNTGHICNIASSAGIVSNPKMSVYAASKWAVVGWSDSLRLEMLQLKKDVKVTTIMPYYINTGMFDGVKSQLIPILEPEAAAKAIIKSIRKNKKMVTLPRYIYPLTRISQGILTVGAFDWVANHIFGIYKTMQHFVGHKN